MLPPFWRRKKAEKKEAHAQKEEQVTASIKNVPHYDKVISFMSDWIESKYDIVPIPEFIADVYGHISLEVAMDEAKISMLFPSSVNAEANFRNFLKLSLDSLDAGFALDGKAVVGFRKTIVNRKYIDGFVNCMEDVYGVSWRKIQSRVNKTKSYPILLIGNQLAFAVAPILLANVSPTEVAWEKGKYDPKSKTPVSTVKRLDIAVDLNKMISQIKDGGIVAVYRCPHCGGKLKIGRATTVESLSVCEHCGTEIEAMELADFLRTALS